jgi:predicted MFS family arabinose efflux permease
MADTLVIAYVGRLLIGAGSAFFFVCALKFVSVWFPPAQFAFVSGTIMFIGVAGGIAGQAPVATAVEVFGWRSVVMVTAGGGLILGILSWLIVIDHPDHLSGQNNQLENHSSMPILVGLKLAIRQKKIG